MRDFIGYGEHPPRTLWPDGARVAVSLVVNYEEGAERSIAAGDERDEDVSVFGGWSADPSKRSLMKESHFEYGSRAGIWRFLGMFREFGVPATFMVCGAALEHNPEAALAIVRDGHEVCAHGYRWRGTVGMSPAEEEAEIRAALDAIERTAGVTPVGWYVRDGITENTRALLVKHGFLYDSNSYSDDRPYTVSTANGRHLVVPYASDTNDGRFWGSGSLASGDDFLRTLIDSLDCLLVEQHSAPTMMSVGLHPRIGGHPSVAMAVRRFIDYAQLQEGVWFATREQIARAWLASPAADRTVGQARATSV